MVFVVGTGLLLWQTSADSEFINQGVRWNWGQASEPEKIPVELPKPWAVYQGLAADVSGLDRAFWGGNSDPVYTDQLEGRGSSLDDLKAMGVRFEKQLAVEWEKGSKKEMYQILKSHRKILSMADKLDPEWRAEVNRQEARNKELYLGAAFEGLIEGSWLELNFTFPSKYFGDSGSPGGGGFGFGASGSGVSSMDPNRGTKGRDERLPSPADGAEFDRFWRSGKLGELGVWEVLKSYKPAFDVEAALAAVEAGVKVPEWVPGNRVRNWVGSTPGSAYLLCWSLRDADVSIRIQSAFDLGCAVAHFKHKAKRLPKTMVEVVPEGYGTGVDGVDRTAVVRVLPDRVEFYDSRSGRVLASAGIDSLN